MTDQQIKQDMIKYFKENFGRTIQPERSYKYYYFLYIPNTYLIYFQNNNQYEQFMDIRFPPIQNYTLYRYTTTYHISRKTLLKRIYKIAGQCPIIIPQQHINNKRWNS